MHEWALAESVLKSASEYSKKQNFKKVLEIVVVLGELQQIERDIFKFALKEVAKSLDTLLVKTKIKIETEPAKFKCRACTNEFTFADFKKINKDEAEYIHFIPEMAYIYLKCTKCKSPDFDLIQGRGVYIKYIKGIQD